jgi:hypothetical protein
MTQKVLDDLQVNSVFKKMCCKRVSEAMYCCLFIYPDLFTRMSEYNPDG